MTQPNSLTPKHGGYRNLKSFQLAQLVYDVTVPMVATETTRLHFPYNASIRRLHLHGILSDKIE